jgi:murein DD-endopeptidase MepM/ murein hydrolase activator NlpD
VAQRKARNRTVLALLVLGLVNAYVFVGSGDTLGSLGSLGAASIGTGRGPLPPLAEPPEQACGGDPVRIFEGLEGLTRLETSLQGGYTLRLGLLALGVAGEDIDRLETSIRTTVDLSLLGGSGAPVRIAADRLGRVHALEIELAEGHVLQACRRDESFEVRNIQHPLRTDVEVISLELSGDADLGRAVEQAGENPELAGLVAQTLAHDVDFMSEARPGDEIQVMVEKRWLGRRFHRYGAALAVRFHGAITRAAYFRYKPEGGESGFFDGEGQPMRRKFLRSPVAFFSVDPEARGMLVPAIEVVEGRIGASYRLPEGAPVIAIADGIIRAAASTLEQGNFIDLELEGGSVIRYCHLHRFIGPLEEGTEVRQGQVLGLAGHSGRTPHSRLRMELWETKDGEVKTVDPLRIAGQGEARAPRVGAPIPASQQARYKEDVVPWRRALTPR